MKWPRRSTREPIPGHGSAWTGFVVGIAASIAANVLHAMEGAWTYPELVGAAFWPTALLISVEVLTRVAWPRGWQWILARFAGVVVVAFVAAALSYLHMRSLLLSWGEGRFQATIGPAAVDGLMLISATALLAVSRSKRPTTATVTASAAAPVTAVAGRVDESSIVDAVLARLPQIPEMPAAPAVADRPALRIPLSGGRRPGRRRATLAGRRPKTAPKPEPIEAATQLAIASMGEESRHRLRYPGIPYGGATTPTAEPVKTPALNGHNRPTSAPIDPKPAAKPAKKPARKPAAKTTGRRAGALDDASYDKAFRYWQDQSAAGNPPSAQQLADVIGRSKATGGRLLQEFREKVSA